MKWFNAKRLLLYASIRVWTPGIVLIALASGAQTNPPGGEVIRSNSVPSPPPATADTNAPSITNGPGRIVLTNLPAIGTNVFTNVYYTNAIFPIMTNWGPLPPFTPPPPKPWWRRIWDWFWS
jgi:hypothetical protein